MLSLFTNKAQSVLFTALITTLVSAIIIFFFPRIEKYSAKLEYSENKYGNSSIFYEDIDNDGTSEKFLFFNDLSGFAHYVFQKDGKTLYQHNINGRFLEGNFFCFGDYNRDSKKEIYLFWHRSDSIFLNVVEAISEKLIAEKVFISKLNYRGKLIDTIIQTMFSQDIDNDGFEELFFHLECGFSVSNRKNMVYYPKQNRLSVSQARGVNLYPPIDLRDISGDGISEIFGNRKSNGNTKNDYFLTDQKIWFYVPDINHQFLFPPKIIGEYPGSVSTAPIFVNKTPLISALCLNYGGNYDSTFLTMYNLQGKLVNKVKLTYTESLERSIFISYPTENPEKLKILKTDGQLIEFDNQLNELKSHKSLPFETFIRCIDIDEDGENEFLFEGHQNNLIITRHDFLHPVSIDLGNLFKLNCVSVKKTDKKSALFCLNTERNFYEIDYHKNTFFIFRYAFYAFLWISLFVVIYYTGRYYQRIVSRRFESENQLAALQISALEKQLTPHFNLNILNSIGALYETQETSKAQYYMGKYSKLLRNLLMRSDKISVNIDEELDFTRDYLVLEKLRMNDKFEYSIEGESEFLEIEIPKMLLHTFCENAIKHGIRHSDKKGKLEIRFFKGEKQLKIFISDNGIGRAKARQYSSMSTGKGLKIINQALELYFQLKQVRIKYNISDIYDELQNAAGTKVEITIPMH